MYIHILKIIYISLSVSVSCANLGPFERREHITADVEEVGVARGAREVERALHQLGPQGVRSLPVLGKRKHASEPPMMQLGNHISSLWNLNNRAKAPSSRVSTAWQAVLQREVDGVLHHLRPQGVRALPVLYR